MTATFPMYAAIVVAPIGCCAALYAPKLWRQAAKDAIEYGDPDFGMFAGAACSYVFALILIFNSTLASAIHYGYASVYGGPLLTTPYEESDKALMSACLWTGLIAIMGFAYLALEATWDKRPRQGLTLCVFFCAALAMEAEAYYVKREFLESSTQWYAIAVSLLGGCMMAWALTYIAHAVLRRNRRPSAHAPQLP